MTQTLTERCDAIRSLLPYRFAHLWHLAKITPAYGDSTPPDGPPPAPWVTMDCDGHCARCTYGGECRGETMERVRAYWIRAYRMDAIAQAYDALEPYLERAVRLVYVEPTDERSECVSEQAKIMRRRVADDGVECMARMIRGDIVGLGERSAPKPKAPETRERNQEIVTLRCEGKSYREIAKAIGCSKNTVAAVLTGKELRQGRAVSPSFAVRVR